MPDIYEVLEFLWDEHNTSYVSNLSDMFTEEEVEFADNYAIVLKNWNSGKLEAFTTTDELINKYKHKI